jgi:hypothetical protein
MAVSELEKKPESKIRKARMPKRSSSGAVFKKRVPWCHDKADIITNFLCVGNFSMRKKTRKR